MALRFAAALDVPVQELLQTGHAAGEREAVRDNFRKVQMCRTPALGGEVYASAAEEKVFYHTCKSKCCPSCGKRGTILWQREQWATLPDIPFVGVVLTMPDVFWPVFKAHRHLQTRSTRFGRSGAQSVGMEPVPGASLRHRDPAHLRRASQTTIRICTSWFLLAA